MVSAWVVGHLDDAWKRFISGTDGSIQLSDEDMDEVISQYDIINKFITPLVKECEMSKKGWKNREKLAGADHRRYGYGYSYGSYYRDRSWGAALGGISIKITSSCFPCGHLDWCASIHDQFDFDNMRSWLKHAPRNIVVLMVKFPNMVFECGWKNFYHDGSKCGEEKIN